ncbi:hypothetical protein SKAU_G00127270 [Synaphobranchus kaupii]|uniref:Uncharacterized protein n=1 Tax=Synaphobranchus kaupii TaxID=118154 RepID=A0A9Q1FPP0_SYNKA|nr:hypothetical protein SKAU_G00127270 [Synaphobranchus kaupii]
MVRKVFPALLPAPASLSASVPRACALTAGSESSRARWSSLRASGGCVRGAAARYCPSTPWRRCRAAPMGFIVPVRSERVTVKINNACRSSEPCDRGGVGWGLLQRAGSALCVRAAPRVGAVLRRWITPVTLAVSGRK